jgi:uncharacterized membrane protein (UPF0127 family)
MHVRVAISVLTAVWAVLGLPCSAGAAPAAQQTVEIATSRGVHFFAVEVADTEDKISRGLAGRKELPEGRGMLFDFRFEQHATMGTKDTLIPLDMIFIKADGRIHRIAENVEPRSTRQIYSGGPVRGVLEVPPGPARKFGIAPGDRVAHPIFRSRR